MLLLVILLHQILRVSQSIGKGDTSLREAIILGLVSDGGRGHSLRNSLVGIGTQHNQCDHVDTVPEKILVVEGLDPRSNGSDVSESLSAVLDGVPGMPVLQGANSPLHLAQGTVRVSKLPFNKREPPAKTREPSEVENKMILMGHQISSCHAPVVRSFKGNSKVIY